MTCRESEEYMALDLTAIFRLSSEPSTRRTLPTALIARSRGSKSVACMRCWLSVQVWNRLRIFWWSAAWPCRMRSNESD